MSLPEALWCDECHRLVEPGELGENGTCPRCGGQLETDADAQPRRRRIPWTFKTMIAATIVYLGYRAYQGVTWVIHHV